MPLAFTRIRPRVPFRLACVLLAATLSACDFTSDPQGLEGSYSLYTANGRRPPVAVWGHWAAGEVQVVDADVRLRGNGAVSVALTTRVMGADSVVGPEERKTYEGTFQQQGEVLSMGWLHSDDGRQASASGVIISPHEIAVTMHFAGSSYIGYYEYPVFMIARR